MKALLIFDLQEEKWKTLLEKSEEDKPGSLQIAAYEGHVCLLALDWFPLNGSFGRRSYGGAFLQHPMVRAMEELENSGKGKKADLFSFMPQEAVMPSSSSIENIMNSWWRNTRLDSACCFLFPNLLFAMSMTFVSGEFCCKHSRTPGVQ
ncbi:hypothetical protein MPTK2_4g18770 [Marchantia polymorpha subsp. ruderalis]